MSTNLINSAEEPGFQFQKRWAARVLMAELEKLENFVVNKFISVDFQT